MRTPILLALSLLGTLFVAPPASAMHDCIEYRDCDPCDSDNFCDWVADAIAFLGGVEARVTQNPDGSRTVSYHSCTQNGCTWRNLATVPPVPGTCFTYNPSAIANGCVTTGSQQRTVTTPTVGTSPTTVCVIGYEVCPSVPVPVLGSQPTTVTHPDVDGYVEVTFLCGSTRRVTLP